MKIEKLYLPDAIHQVICRGGILENSANTKVIYKVNDLIDAVNKLLQRQEDAEKSTTTKNKL